MSILLDNLNTEQRAIVTDTDGYKLVLAGAGSGKTRVLTYSIAYLIEEGLANPHNILAVTFTNKAANEMKDRIRQLIPSTKESSWWVGTFHGNCVRILVRYGNKIGIPTHFTIADEKEQKSVAKNICKNYPEMDPARFLNRVGDAKNNLKVPGDYAISSEKIDVDFSRAYDEYQTTLEKMNTLDFDDLIMKTVQLLRNVPEVREHLQNQFKYVLVDESQDLNKSQYELSLLLSGKHNNLALVGDSDQGIYSWRGANINIINGFANLEQTKVMELSQNYRSTKTIIESASQMIKNNKNRIDKGLFTDNEIGEKIIVHKADTEFDEAMFVADIIEYYCHTSREQAYSDFAILFRTNGQGKAVEDALNKCFIPYKIINGMSFYEKKEIKDMVAYLRLMVNPYDILAFQRIINTPKRGVGETTVAKITDFIIQKELPILEALANIDEIPRINKKTKAAIEEFRRVMEDRLAVKDTQNPERFIRELATATGYLDMLDEEGEKDRVRNIYELAYMADYKFEKEGTSLEEYIKELSLISDSDSIDDDDDVVKLMTVHTAKGLEFPMVFVVGMEENIFPHFLSIKSNDSDELEEERRSFYVAMTRAEKRLYLTSAEKRSLFGDMVKNKKSRFLEEIPTMFIKKTS